MPGANAHDALQDTKNALILFTKTIDKINNLANKYPILNHFTSQTNFSLAPYLEHKNSNLTTKITDIPKLSKILPSHTQTQTTESTLDINTLENQKRYYTGNINLKTFLERIVPNKNILLAFSNLQKLDITKNLLNDMGLKNIGFLKDEQLIDYEKFEKFFNKPSFSNEEVKFIIKYYSHLDQGLGLLDLNCKTDYQIYHTLKNTKSKTRYPIVLATHQGLFSHFQEGENEYQDYDIFFLDAERRYKSYNFFLARPVDMYYTLTLLENLIYKQHFQQEINSSTNPPELLEHFYTSFQIFIGQLFMESKGFFVHTQAENIQVNPITTDPSFYKTNLLRKQIKENYEELKAELEPQDFLLLEKQILHIDTIFNTVITIQKKMNNADMYFVYSENTQYTSRSEFVEIFTSDVYFFSNSDKKAIDLFPNETKKVSVPTIQI